MKTSTTGSAVGSNVVAGYKFQIPQALSNTIRRQRLLSDILTSPQYSAVIIQGPAGHGKTTLMQQILAELKAEGYAIGWLTLDESDNDVSRFNACLSMLAGRATGATQGSAIPTASGTGALNYILQLLAQAEGSLALFMDEFQLLTEPVSLALVNTLLERAPPNVTFYVGSRSIPDLARGRLMISGRVKWIRPEELCFTRAEVQAFLSSVRFEVSEEEAESFRERTGGWPAALQLLQLALRGGQVTRKTLSTWAAGCQTELRDYLADNVMAYQSPERREFLLRTGILERLCAPLCEQLTGVENAQQLLLDLVAQGMFIRTADMEYRWFRYHSIFSTYLRAQLQRQHPESVNRLHRQAARWFDERDMAEEAAHHALSAGDTAMAAAIINRAAPGMVRDCRLTTVDRWCRQLPEATISEFPMLAQARCWAHLFLNQPAKAEISLAEYSQSLERSGASGVELQSLFTLQCMREIICDSWGEAWDALLDTGIDTGNLSRHRCFEMGALANAKAILLLQRQRFSEARELALTGEALSVRGEAAFSGAYSTSLLAYAMLQDGHLVDGLRRLEAGLNDEQIHIQGSFATVALSAIYGLALYESGDYAGAESHLRDNIDIISQSATVDWLAPSFLALSRASDLTGGETEDSLDILDRGEKLGLINRQPRMVRAIRRERVRRALLAGNCREAQSIYGLLQAEQLPGQAPGRIHLSESCEDDLVCRARMEIHCGDGSSVSQPLQDGIAEAQSSGNVRRLIKLQLLQCLILAGQGNEEAALRTLKKLIAIASGPGYMSTFIEEGERSIDLVSTLLGRHHGDGNGEKAFLQRILTAAGREWPGEQGQVRRTLLEPLTRKEQEILKLVVSGASNGEIADQVFVSKNTVKFHLKNIYSKLGAVNRVQATGIARELNLA